MFEDPIQPLVAIRGRGAASNPANRFERLARIPNDDDAPDAPETVLYRDTSRTIISRNDSPDVGFDASINPYRGCEHGCVYCYARPTHEYLGLSAGLDFESRIFVKEDAAELLRRELTSPKWEPQSLTLCGVTDAYQPVERRLGITRSVLEVLLEFRNPVCVVTKSNLVARDVDILSEMSTRYDAAAVFVSVTTLDRDLARSLEPRAPTPDLRFEAIRTLADAGVKVGVMTAPLIPGLTDHEAPALLEAAAAAGATFAGYTVVRLPLAVAPLFEEWLDVHAPGRKQKVLNRLRSMRDGRLNDPRFGKRMKGEGPFAEQIRGLFHLGARRAGISTTFPTLSVAHFRRPGQMALFS